LKRAACGSLKIQDTKIGQKFGIWAPSQLCCAVSLQLRHVLTIGKKSLSLQYGELRPTDGWDRFTSLGHPSTFQRVLRIGSVTAWHSSSGRQPNFSALNRGCHLYLARRPSHLALAHILVKYGSQQSTQWPKLWC